MAHFGQEKQMQEKERHGLLLKKWRFLMKSSEKKKGE